MLTQVFVIMTEEIGLLDWAIKSFGPRDIGVSETWDVSFTTRVMLDMISRELLT